MDRRRSIGQPTIGGLLFLIVFAANDQAPSMSRPTFVGMCLFVVPASKDGRVLKAQQTFERGLYWFWFEPPNDGGNRAAAEKLGLQNPRDRRLRFTAWLCLH